MYDAARLLRGGTVLLAALTAAACGEAAAEDWRTLNSSRQAGGEELLAVEVEYGAGTLNLGSSEPGILYSARVHYDAATFTPVVDYTDGRLRLGVEGGTVRGRNVRAGELDLRLTPEVPVDLSVRFGAAEANLDLGGLHVDRLEIQTGASRTVLDVSAPNPQRCRSATIQVGAARFEARRLGNLNAERLSVQGGVGEVTLDFTGEWAAGMSASVEMGLGALTLRVPRGLALRINREGRLASFDSEGLVKRGDSYYSENWSAEDTHLTVDIKAALGSIRVVWLDT
ncbi:MAG TPA: hypothetical protein VK936_12330 [Longimicrobiales bacterium]|nr:hypothetical protein [Longimicrobiales bacterium]